MTVYQILIRSYQLLIENSDMAKASLARKRGVNLPKKRTSESITPGDESTLVQNKKYKRVTARDDVVDSDSSHVGDPPTSEVASVPNRPQLNKAPPTQVFQKPITTLDCAVDNASFLEDAAVKKPSVLLTTALCIGKDKVDLQLQNRASLQDSTIMTLQNTNRELLSNQEQSKQFSKCDHEITKIVGKFFQISKFAYFHVSKHYILTLLLTYIHLSHNPFLYYQSAVSSSPRGV